MHALYNVLLNNGLRFETPRSDVPPEVIALLSPFVKRLSRGTEKHIATDEVPPGYAVTGAGSRNTLLVEVRRKPESLEAPTPRIVLFGVAASERGGEELWRLMHDPRYRPGLPTADQQAPALPWSAAFVEKWANPDELSLLGTFMRCVAWTWLAHWQSSQPQTRRFQIAATCSCPGCKLPVKDGGLCAKHQPLREGIKILAAAVRNATSLEGLRDAMLAHRDACRAAGGDPDDTLDCYEFPTFGGKAVRDAERVLSWDQARLLVSSDAGELQILERPEIEDAVDAAVKYLEATEVECDGKIWYEYFDEETRCQHRVTRRRMIDFGKRIRAGRY